MDKNYYDILQINVNASPEIIEKAYKTLAKKYHPDLQPEEKKEEAEQILKEINEAYEVLSDTIKKQEYDTKLKQQKEYEEQKKWQNYQTYQNSQNTKTKEQVYQQHVYQESKKTQESQNESGPINYQYKSSTLQEQTMKKRQLQYEEEQLKQEQLKQQEFKKQLEYERQMEYARQKAYHDAYIQDLKSRGYKIRYKKTFKDYITGAISIIAVIFIFFLLWQIPFIRNYFINFYKENEIIHFLVDTIINLFQKT